MVSPRSVTEVALVPSKGSPHMICGGPSGTMTSFLRVPWFSPSVSFHNFFILKQNHSYQGGKRATTGNLQIQQCSFGIGEQLTKSYFMVFFLDFKEAMFETGGISCCFEKHLSFNYHVKR